MARSKRRGNKPSSPRGQKAYRQRDALAHSMQIEQRRRQLNLLRKLRQLQLQKNQITAKPIGKLASVASERSRPNRPEVTTKRFAQAAPTTRNGTADGRKERNRPPAPSAKQIAAPKRHSKNSPRATCKERPLSNLASTGPGAGNPKKEFVPWCGSDFGSHRRKR